MGKPSTREQCQGVLVLPEAVVQCGSVHQLNTFVPALVSNRMVYN